MSSVSCGSVVTRRQRDPVVIAYWRDKYDWRQFEARLNAFPQYRTQIDGPEPVFGQIKQARAFRQFLLRGFEKVRAEWALVCTAHID
jgi:hypothetical protein